MIESLLGSSTGTLTAELNGHQWPVIPPIFTWIYQHVNRILEEKKKSLLFFIFRVVLVKMKCLNILIVVLII